MCLERRGLSRKSRDERRWHSDLISFFGWWQHKFSVMEMIRVPSDAGTKTSHFTGWGHHSPSVGIMQFRLHINPSCFQGSGLLGGSHTLFCQECHKIVSST